MSFLKTSVVFLLLIYASTAWAIDFDIWNTGISRQEMTSLAKEHNLPLAKDGLYHSNKTFNPTLLAGEANCFYYKTQLLGHPARVRLYLSPRKGKYGQFLYEIEILFTDIRKNKDLKPYLSELLKKKYGSGSFGTNLIQRFRVWNPEKNAEVRLISGPGSLQLKYTDLKIKNIAEQLSKSTYSMPTPPKHEDASKF
jgi:hypothetical protein